MLWTATGGHSPTDVKLPNKRGGGSVGPVSVKPQAAIIAAPRPPPGLFASTAAAGSQSQLPVPDSGAQCSRSLHHHHRHGRHPCGSDFIGRRDFHPEDLRQSLIPVQSRVGEQHRKMPTAARDVLRRHLKQTLLEERDDLTPNDAANLERAVDSMDDAELAARAVSMARVASGAGTVYRNVGTGVGIAAGLASLENLWHMMRHRGGKRGLIDGPEVWSRFADADNLDQ